MPGAVGGAGKRWIFEPAQIGRDVGRMRDPQAEHAAEIKPEAERAEVVAVGASLLPVLLLDPHPAAPTAIVATQAIAAMR